MQKCFCVIFLLFWLSSELVAGGNIPLGAIKVKPQFTTFQGAQRSAAQIDMEIGDGQDQLSLLRQAFVCPAPDDPSRCQQVPACRCDFSTVPLQCSQLPSCCQSEAAFASACGANQTALNWTVLSADGPTQRLWVPAASSSSSSGQLPAYLRYHPSAEAQCRGFGLALLPPYEETSSVVSTAHVWLIYLSWTHAQPELDPNALRLTPKAVGGQRQYRYRFCPDPVADNSSSAAYFFGPSNTRTAFISIASLTQGVERSLQAVDLTISLRETKDINSALQVPLASLPTQQAQRGSFVLLPDQASVGGASGVTVLTPLFLQFSYGSGIVSTQPANSTAIGAEGLRLIYTHNATTCQNVAFSIHTLWPDAIPGMYLGPGDDLRAAVRSESACNSWMLNMCPGEQIRLSVVLDGSSSPLFISIHFDPVFEQLALSNINPNLYAPILTESFAALTVCRSTSVAFLKEPRMGPEVRSNYPGYFARCYSMWTEEPLMWLCSSFYLFPPRQNATFMWPAPPVSLLGGRYSSFDHLRLSASIGEEVPGTMRAVFILDSKDFQPYTPYESPQFNQFVDFDQLNQCSIFFYGVIVNQDGDRLYGYVPLAPPDLSSQDCDPVQLGRDRQQMSAISKRINDNLGLVTVTDLLEQAIFALKSDIAVCSYQAQRYLTASNVSLSTNCSIYNPCCPSADGFTQYFYDYCTEQNYLYYSPNQVATELLTNETLTNEECVSSLMEEVVLGQSVVAKPIDALNKVACAPDSIQQDSLLLRRGILHYYQSCRSRYVGPFDEGLPCQSDLDCLDHPQVVCQRSTLAQPSESVSYRASKRRLPKTCQAPPQVWDALIFQCLIDTMPAVIASQFQLIVGQFSSQELFSEAIWNYTSQLGCGSDFPTSLLETSPTIELNTALDFCRATDFCPFPVRCLDSFCESTPTCAAPWSNCVPTWSPQSSGPTEEECVSQFRCNLIASNSSVPYICQASTSSECEQECQTLNDDQPAFCGYCDEVTGFCYRAVDANTGSPLTEAQCALAGCLFEDVGVLHAGTCPAQLGTCTMYPEAEVATPVVTRDTCLSQAGLCLNPADRSLVMGDVPGCLGSTMPYNFGCYNSLRRMTDAGCFWVNTEGERTTGYPANASQCDGQRDPLLPDSGPFRGWLEAITSEEACLQDERLFLCFLPLNDTSPLSGFPNLNPRNECLARGGTFRSPFVWEDPLFLPGVAVNLSWIPVRAQATGSWQTRFDYLRFSAAIDFIVDYLQTEVDILTATCTYSNTFSLAMQAVACGNVNNTPEMVASAACQPLNQIDSSSLPPSQFLGSGRQCLPRLSTGDVKYPSMINIPPLTVSLQQDSRVQQQSAEFKGCFRASVQLYSNARFIPSRRRIRESSFFLFRQDMFIPSLSTLSSIGAANGFILSDSVQLRSSQAISAESVIMCVRARSDFKAKVAAATQDEPRLYVTLGVLEDWQVRPLVLPSRAIYTRYISSNDTLLEVSGSLLQGSVEEIIEVCALLSSVELGDQAQSYVAVVTFQQDPETVDNGFNTAETVWLYITAGFYLAPVVLLYVPSLIYLLAHRITLLTPSQLAVTFLSFALIFRATLLFCLADGAIAESSTAEFALSDITVWCEFTALSLLTLSITLAWLRSRTLKKAKSFAKSKSLRVMFLLLAGSLLALYVAFVVAYGVSGDSSSGVTTPTTTCAGRLPDEEVFWSTRRILRFTYEVVLVVCCLLLGLWLAFCAYILFNLQNIALRTAIGNVVLCFAIVSHGIISLILIGTEYNSYAFGIVMLYLTELIPLTIFVAIASWKNLHASALSVISAATSRSRSPSRRSRSPSRRSDSPSDGSRSPSRRSTNTI